MTQKPIYILDEIKEISQLVAELPFHELDKSVPTEYFSNLEKEVMAQVALHKVSSKATNPSITPSEYFLGLEDKIVDKINQKPASKVKIYSLRPLLKIAAALFVISMVFYWGFNDNSSLKTPEDYDLVNAYLEYSIDEIELEDLVSKGILDEEIINNYAYDGMIDYDQISETDLNE